MGKLTVYNINYNNNIVQRIKMLSMVDRVAAAVTKTMVVTKVVGTVSMPMVFFDVDGHMLLHVHWVRHMVSYRDLDRHLDRVWHWAIDWHRDVLLDVHGVRHRFLNGHWVRYVFFDWNDDRSVNDDWHLFGDVHSTDVSVAVIGTQQTVVGQTVPLTVSTISIAQAPEASFALLLFRRLLIGGRGGGLHGVGTD